MPLVHVRNTIEHLVESGIIEGELADTWKERMTEKRDGEEKVKKFMKEANEGDANAIYNIAICYMQGNGGLKEDFSEAYKWAKKGADMRHVESMALAGRSLAEGFGTEQSVSDGLILTSMSAQQGCSTACMFLGELYYEGRHGVVKNIENAKDWLRKALEGKDDTLSSDGVDTVKELLREIEALEAAPTSGNSGDGNSESNGNVSDSEDE